MQESQSQSDALLISNVLPIKHVGIEVVSIFALLISHAVHLQFVRLEITKHLVLVHQGLKETLIDNVTKVRNMYNFQIYRISNIKYL